MPVAIVRHTVDSNIAADSWAVSPSYSSPIDPRTMIVHNWIGQLALEPTFASPDCHYNYLNRRTIDYYEMRPY